MGIFTDGEDRIAPEKIETPEAKIETDVPGVFADGEVRMGADAFPVFKVERAAFFDNMHADRKRMRFPTDSDVTKYMRNTKYRRPFFVEYQGTDGKSYRRKVK